jgi:hypothetical protein
MTRAELIRMFVLWGICDDFEDIERISDSVTEFADLCGLTISHDEIIEALRESIELGHANAFDSNFAGDVELARDDIEPLNPRFGRTKEGLAFDCKTHEGSLEAFILGWFRPPFTHVRLASLERAWKESHGTAVPRAELIQALRRMTASGYLTPSYKDDYLMYDRMPPLEEIRPYRAYFWITARGWDYLNANEQLWPFESDEERGLTLRPDWTSPRA